MDMEKLEKLSEDLKTSTAFNRGYSAAQKDFLCNALLASAKLSYDGTELNFDDYTLRTVIKVLYPGSYRDKLNELRREKNDAE